PRPCAPVPTMRRWQEAAAQARTTRTTIRPPCFAVAKPRVACRPWKARAWTIWTSRRSCAVRPTEFGRACCRLPRPVCRAGETGSPWHELYGNAIGVLIEFDKKRCMQTMHRFFHSESRSPHQALAACLRWYGIMVWFAQSAAQEVVRTGVRG